MTEAHSTRQPRSEAWERWLLGVHALWYVALAIALCGALLGAQTRLSAAGSAGLSALLGLWYWLLVVKRPELLRRPGPMLLFFAGAVPLWIALTALSSWFLLLTFVFYPLLYCLLPLGWAVAASLPLVGVAIWRSAVANGEALTLGNPTVLSGLASIVFNAVLAYWIGTVVQQNAARRQLIEELQQTRLQLAEAERHAGMLEERQRLSREIHDSLAQGFASIVMHLEAADAALGNDDTARGHVGQARSTARDSLSQTRQLVWALRRPGVERASLDNELGRLVQRWAAGSGVAAELAITGQPFALAPEQEVMLLHAARETLANVRKHAGAGRVTLTLSFMNDTVALDIQDDGSGFVASELAPGHSEGGWGLRGLRERAEQLGGQLDVESAPGEGTTVAVQLPANAAGGAGIR